MTLLLAALLTSHPVELEGFGARISLAPPYRIFKEVRDAGTSDVLRVAQHAGRDLNVRLAPSGDSVVKAVATAKIPKLISKPGAKSTVWRIRTDGYSIGFPPGYFLESIEESKLSPFALRSTTVDSDMLTVVGPLSIAVELSAYRETVLTQPNVVSRSENPQGQWFEVVTLERGIRWVQRHLVLPVDPKTAFIVVAQTTQVRAPTVILDGASWLMTLKASP